MPFKKGESGNPKGRKKGSPNIVTQEHRELINTLISCPDDLQGDLQKLEPKERIDAIIKLLEFTTPKQARVINEVTGDLSISSVLFKDAKKKE